MTLLNDLAGCSIVITTKQGDFDDGAHRARLFGHVRVTVLKMPDEPGLPPRKMEQRRLQP
jgi:hypothetical protein